jgi:hypothetical protein
LGTRKTGVEARHLDGAADSEPTRVLATATKVANAGSSKRRHSARAFLSDGGARANTGERCWYAGNGLERQGIDVLAQRPPDHGPEGSSVSGSFGTS